MTALSPLAILPESGSRGFRQLAILGVLLFCTGTVLLLVAQIHIWLVGLRWAGLVCLSFTALRKKSLTYWIFFAMLLGGEIGFDYPSLAGRLNFLSDIFLRLIEMIVAPLILGSLISGIAGHGDLRTLGRVAIKTLIYFEVVTTLALFIGVAAIDLSHAGAGVSISQTLATPSISSPAPTHWNDFLVHLFPENLAQSIAQNQVLQVAVFAVLFGIALTFVPEASRTPLLSFCKSLTQVMFSFTNIVMYFAPIGVGAAMAYAASQMGAGALLVLAKLLLTSYGALLVFVAVVLLPVALWARLPLLRFWNAVAEPVGIAFATSTSEAALPRAMEQMEFFGAPREIVAFVIPIGYSFNMDGSTLYLGISSIFVAQAAGIHLHWTNQLAMVFALMLMSKGVAGVPRTVLVILTAAAAMFHLPSGPIVLILGIDALIDMARTAVNVLGNCLAAAVIAQLEGTSLPNKGS